MCSLGDDDAGELYIPKEQKPINSLEAKCGKCQSQSGWVVLQQRHVYCSECFNYKVTHKVRSTLGKSKIMKPSDVVLVGFSGSPSALMLLHGLWMATQEQGHKKTLYDIKFCFIDDGDVINLTPDERQQLINQNKTLVESYGFKFYVTSLEDTDGVSNTELLKNIKSLTSKEDMLLKLRMRSLVQKARELMCTKLFTSETQNRLAVKLLTSIALGRGEQLSQEMILCDSRYSDILVLRPLLEVEDKEVACYNTLHKLPMLTRTGLTTGLASTASISRLTDEFLRGLHKEFPNAVANVFRTGEKLTASVHTDDVGEKCVLCEGNLVVQDDRVYNAAQATAFSSQVSNPVSDATSSQPHQLSETSSCQENSTEKGCCGSGTCSSKEGPIFEFDMLKSCFCYGCRLIISELKTMKLLPANVYSAAVERSSLASMREQISEFLL